MSHHAEEEWLNQTLNNLCSQGVAPALGDHAFSFNNYSSQFNYPTHERYPPAKGLDTYDKYAGSLKQFLPPPTPSVPAASSPFQQHKQDYFSFKHSAPPLVVNNQKAPHYFGFPKEIDPSKLHNSVPQYSPPSTHQTPPLPNCHPPSRAPTTYEQQPMSSQFAPELFNTVSQQNSFAGFLDRYAFARDLPYGSEKEILKKQPASKKIEKVPPRRVRPKVVESKGAVQCAGTNLKKGTQCKNAALMEFIGPRPIYCAEHIELDPESIYCKCTSSYGKTPGDGKGCKEVVLKEFEVCYKHFEDRLEALPKESAVFTAERDLIRVKELLSRLEIEAASAKRKRHDLFQRKNKLIPKFAKMLTQLEEFIAKRKDSLESPVIVDDELEQGVVVPYESQNSSQLSNFLDEEWKTLFPDS